VFEETIFENVHAMASTSDDKQERFPAAEVLNQSGETCAATDQDQSFDMFPLLKVSPPIPVGRLAGRFKVQVWRASVEHKLHVTLHENPQGGVVVKLDATHLGIYSGDEVLSINDISVQNFRHFHELVESCGQDLEIQFFRQEARFSPTLFEDDLADFSCGPSSMCVPQTMPVWCDYFYNPPEPRCRPETFLQREVLAASKTELLPGPTLRLHVMRTSMKQPFGLPLGIIDHTCEPSEASQVASEDVLLATPKSHRICVSESFFSDGDASDPCEMQSPDEEEAVSQVSPGSPCNLRGPVVMLRSIPTLGICAGDEVLRINGEEIPDLASCKAALKRAVRLTVDLRRPDAIPAFLSEADSPAITVNYKTSRRSDDWHSASSTKDGSRETIPEESWWQSLWRMVSCTNVGWQADSFHTERLQKVTSQTDLEDAVQI